MNNHRTPYENESAADFFTGLDSAPKSAAHRTRFTATQGKLKAENSKTPNKQENKRNNEHS